MQNGLTSLILSDSTMSSRFTSMAFSTDIEWVNLPQNKFLCECENGKMMLFSVIARRQEDC